MRLFDRFFVFIFLLIPFTWGGSFIAAKYVVHDIDPVSMVVLRFFLSAMIMLPWLFLFHRNHHPNFKNLSYWFHLLILVIIGGISYHIFFFWGIKYTSPTNAAIIIALNPFFTAFAEIIFFKNRRSTRFYIGFIISFSGAIWVNIARGGHIDFSNLGLGEFLCLIASLLWSTYAITAKATKREGWDSLWLNAYNYLLTALLLIPFTRQMFTSEFWQAISAPAWLGIWYMVIFPTTIGYTMFYVGVQRKGPAWASTFIYLVPSITANLDFLFFNALLTPPMVIGTTMVVIGLIYGNLGEKQLVWLKNILIRLKF